MISTKKKLRNALDIRNKFIEYQIENKSLKYQENIKFLNRKIERLRQDNEAKGETLRHYNKAVKAAGLTDMARISDGWLAEWENKKATASA